MKIVLVSVNVMRSWILVIMFYQSMEHDEIYVMKRPLVFLVIITEGFLRQHSEIVRSYELQSKKGVTLTIDYMPCVGPHVPDIVIFADLVGFLRC